MSTLFALYVIIEDRDKTLSECEFSSASFPILFSLENEGITYVHEICTSSNPNAFIKALKHIVYTTTIIDEEQKSFSQMILTKENNIGLCYFGKELNEYTKCTIQLLLVDKTKTHEQYLMELFVKLQKYDTV
jgi:hypothetical protein